MRNRRLGPLALPLGWLLLFWVALTAACGTDGSSEAPAASGASGPAAAAKPPKALRLGYFANATHAQAVLAVSTGELEAAIAPVKLETKIFNAGPSLIEALFAGEIDVGYVGPGPALSAHSKSKGQGIRVIAGAASNGVVIVARLGSGIEKIEDLKDKRVATPQLGNTQDISARRYLTEVLRQPNAKNVIPVPNAEQAGMMARGQIDAAWAPEPWGQRLIVEAGAKLVAEEKDLWPNAELGLTLVVGSPELLSEQPELVRKVLGVHKSFTARLAASPDALLPELGDALFALTGKELPEGVLPAAIGRVKFTDEIPEETLKTYAQWTFALGFERAAADTAGLLDRSFLGATVAEP